MYKEALRVEQLKKPLNPLFDSILRPRLEQPLQYVQALSLMLARKASTAYTQRKM